MLPAILAGAALAAGAASSIYGAKTQSDAIKDAAKKEAESKRQALASLKEQGQITDAEYDKMLNDINVYYAQRGSMGTQQDVNEYTNAISNYDPSEYVYSFGDFDYDKTKEDFVNPYYSRIMSDTADQVQHTAAGAGLGRGTGAALNIAKATTEKSDELYRTALQDFMQDRDFAYKEYADSITRNQNKLDALREGAQYKMNLQGNLANDYYNTLDQSMQDQMKARQDKLNAQTQFANAIAGLY